MQQWYLCPRCGRYVQYGQPQCFYCGYQIIWNAPPSALGGKLKSIFNILTQKTPTVQYPIPAPPPSYTQPPIPMQPPSYPQAPGPIQEQAPIQPPIPAPPPSYVQPSAPPQSPSYPPEADFVQEPATIQPPTQVQDSSSAQPSATLSQVSSTQPPSPSQADKLKSIIGIPFQTPHKEQQQQQCAPQQKEVSNSSQERRSTKDTLTAYLYWICLGSHYRYLDNNNTQVKFWVTLGGLGLWWLIDIVRIPGMVKDYNINLRLSAVLEAEALTKEVPSKTIQKHERNYQAKKID
jgi:hypothetical protein